MASGGDEGGEEPRLRVIEGGGKGQPQTQAQQSYHAYRAGEHFRILCIELLRALARGDDAQYRVVQALYDLIKDISECDEPIYKILHPVIDELHKEIAPAWDAEGYDAEIRAIVASSLSVAAESCAADGLANARRSKRKDVLQSAVRAHIAASEERRRAHAERHARAGGSKARKATTELIQQRVKALLAAPRPARGRRKRVLTPPGDADKSDGGETQ